MSNRTLIELNHDCAPELASDEFIRALGRYLCSPGSETRAELEMFGARVVSFRHHSDRFYIHQDAEGFPAILFTAAKEG